MIPMDGNARVGGASSNWIVYGDLVVWPRRLAIPAAIKIRRQPGIPLSIVPFFPPFLLPYNCMLPGISQMAFRSVLGCFREEGNSQNASCSPKFCTHRYFSSYRV